MAGPGGRHPLLVLGLDGATFDLARPLMGAGKMPNLSALAAAGGSCVLESSSPPLSPIAWTTFVTGCNPGVHGIFDFAHRREGTYDFVPYTSADRRALALWEFLAERGFRSCVVNVPLTYPASAVEGVMLSGFPTPRAEDRSSYPPGLMGRLHGELGGFDFAKPKALVNEGGEAELCAQIRARTDDEVRVLERLLKDRYDFVMAVFDGPDVAGHLLWKHIDPGHPGHDPKREAEVRGLMEGVYQDMDSALGRVSKAMGPDANVIVASDHGFGPVYHGVYMYSWLKDGGYLKFRRSVPTALRRGANRVGVNTLGLLRLARRLGLVRGVEAAYSSNSLAIGLARKLSLSFADVDWKMTRAYPFGNYGQIFVNLKGREPEGVVEQGAEYEELVSGLCERIRMIEDPATGRKVFDVAVPAHLGYRGPAQGSGPDVVFYDSKEEYVGHRLFEFGADQLIGPHPVYSGHHKKDGMLVAAGPSIAKGWTSLSAGVADMAPTCMALLGLAPPPGLDGRTIEGLIQGRSVGMRDAVAERVRTLKAAGRLP
ncbi:MAG: alkaline phosphatase family protein [Nitrososphaerota archaeon]|nr:alkaline phosphatase family protein [Nitrososphaerota archaeon]